MALGIYGLINWSFLQLCFSFLEARPWNYRLAFAVKSSTPFGYFYHDVWRMTLHWLILLLRYVFLCLDVYSESAMLNGCDVYSYTMEILKGIFY